MNAEQPRRSSRNWLWWVATGLLAASALPVWYSIRGQHLTAAAPVPEKAEGQPRGVSCLGRIEPKGGVIHIAGAHVFGDPHPPVVESLQVKEGDRVRGGDLLAIFVGRAQLLASLEQAQKQTEVARRRLEQVKAGAKKPDLAAQQAEIAQLEAGLENAQSELQRYEALRRTDDVTTSELEARRTAVLVAQRRREESRNRLESLQEVRESDVQVAAAQVQAATANQQRAQRDYEASAVHAPMDGQVLKIHAHPGEEVGTEGLLDMGRTGEMYVVAEVYETDIARVRPGERATVSGDLLGTALYGTVERIDPDVKAASILPGDTAFFSENRIIEVRIRLDHGEAVTGLINGRVTVVIQP